MSAKIPQPREGETRSTFCIWCGAGERMYRLGKRCDCKIYMCRTGGMASEADPTCDRVEASFFCEATPSDLAAVVLDLITERGDDPRTALLTSHAADCTGTARDVAALMRPVRAQNAAAPR